MSQLKAAAFFLVYLLLIQFYLPYLAPSWVIYEHRLDYDLVKDRPTNMEAVLEQVRLIIKREQFTEYVIILGDSVAYSNPGPANESITSRLNEIWLQEGVGYPVFNLAMPAMQLGDVYTMLLKMQRHGISSDRLIINITYAGFIERDPEPPAVYWLVEQLKYLDNAAYEKIEPILPDYAKIDDISITDLDSVKKRLNTLLYENFCILKYKDIFQRLYTKKTGRGKKPYDTSPPPVQPWHTKAFLPELLQQPEYQRDFNVTPFVMDDSNPQYYFLEKIMEIQQGKNTLVFLSGINDRLMEKNISKPGYQENLSRIDEYFIGKDAIYINMYYLIDNEFFSDHIHLTADGYNLLSGILLEEIKKWR
ncbi:MAG: hypothetical protein FWD21_04720 [Peptococcaceae bacterium]|nr:hypothetical protein [Peptococcaceae bacterium]